MDLSDILKKRTEDDLKVAVARSLELSLEISVASKELKYLRDYQKQMEGKFSSENAHVAKPLEKLTESQEFAGLRDVNPKPWYKRLFKKFAGRTSRKPQFNWHLDEIAGVFPVRDKSGVNAHVSHAGFPVLTLSGWIVPLGDEPAFAAAHIVLVGQNRRISRETPTFQRPDVANHFDNPALSSCGFRVEFPMFEVPVGQHILEISAQSPGGGTMTIQAGTITVA